MIYHQSRQWLVSSTVAVLPDMVSEGFAYNAGHQGRQYTADYLRLEYNARALVVQAGYDDGGR